MCNIMLYPGNPSEAQKHPEKYNDQLCASPVIVRFNVLSRITQDDIIARTEQQL